MKQKLYFNNQICMIQVGLNPLHLGYLEVS
jgi:hypothetical protein